MEKVCNPLLVVVCSGIFTAGKQARQLKERTMIYTLISAFGEIKMHNKVMGIEFPRRNEVYIKFKDTFADLVIPINPEMDEKLLVGIFYNYLNRPESRLACA